VTARPFPEVSSELTRLGLGGVPGDPWQVRVLRRALAVQTKAHIPATAAQCDRMPARNVAMPNSTPPKMYSTPSSDYSVARAPTFVSPTEPVKTPKNSPQTWASDCPRAAGDGRKNLRWMDQSTTTAKMSPATIADRPAQWIRFKAVVFTLRSLSRSLPNRDHHDGAQCQH
jgi:hypothetical protein